MKASLLLLAFSLLVPTVRAQSIATNLTGAPQWRATTELSDLSTLDASNQWVPVSNSPQEVLVVAAAPVVSEEGNLPATLTQATAAANGVRVQVETLPCSGTVLVSFEMPQQETPGMLELANARTGQIVYTGSIVVREGQVELPVADASEPFEVRLATDQALLIARMAQ